MKLHKLHLKIAGDVDVERAPFTVFAQLALDQVFAGQFDVLPPRTNRAAKTNCAIPETHPASPRFAITYDGTKAEHRSSWAGRLPVDKWEG